MENMNTGSFGAAIGGSSALQEAMARRGMDAGVLQQQSPASPGHTPMPQGIPGPTGMTQVAGATPAPQGGVAAGPMPGSPEAEMILRAMSERLKHLSKAEQGAQAPPVLPGGLI